MNPSASVEGPPINLVDLQAQRKAIGRGIEEAIAAVLEHGQFIMGPEVADLEAALAGITGAGEVVTCSSGTDSLVLALLAMGVGPGDMVLVPAFTFAATAEAVALLGAIPFFVDVSPTTFTIDPESLAETIAGIEREGGTRPLGVIVVDLFGQPGDYQAINDLAHDHGLWVLADAAQSLGATYRGRPVGTLSHITATSFFPAKPLGCYGDGGALFTDDLEVGTRLRSLRAHGQGADKYDNVRIGINGRLDTIQAAVLLQKLTVFGAEIRRRQEIAARYDKDLADVVVTPCVAEGSTSAWAQYTVVVEDREALRRQLSARGVPTAVYYPTPLHRHAAYKDFPIAPGGLPVSEHLADHVLSLPLHPYLDGFMQERVVEAVMAALGDTMS